MQPIDDSVLLRQYAATSADAAFATLVERHINLVYSVALRHTGNPHHAEEITQAVFIILTKKAPSLRHARALSSWLFQATRLTAGNFVRGEIRRHRREEEAQMQSLLNEPAAGATDVWPQIAPLLDTAIAGLNEADRQAIVLRYFENRSLAEVGRALGANEDAARMRVNRALEKLRGFFAKRGVNSTTAILAGAMSANSVQAAPAGLAQSVAIVAAAKGAAAGGSTLTLIQGALKIMAWTKAKTAVAAGVGLLLATGATTLVVVQERNMYAWEVKHVKFPEILDQVPQQVRILPTKFRFPEDFYAQSESTGREARHIGIAAPFGTLVQMAFQAPHEDRFLLPAGLPAGAYDYIANLRQDSTAALQHEIKRKLGVTGKYETLERDVLLLKVKNPHSAGLKPSVGKNPWRNVEMDGISDTNILMSAFADQLEDYIVRIPIVDQTGLAGPFEFHLHIPGSYMNVEGLKAALVDQLGLELVPGREPIEMLVLEKAK